jgi:hypothetical protein
MLHEIYKKRKGRQAPRAIPPYVLETVVHLKYYTVGETNKSEKDGKC